MAKIGPDHMGLLTGMPLFAGLPRQVLERLTAGAEVQHHPKESTIFQQGHAPDGLHILLDGTVQLLAKSDSGRETIVDMLEPVSAFAPAEALTGAPHLTTARVLRPARMLSIPAADLRREAAREANLALALTASLSGEVRRMVRQVKNLKLRTSTERLGCYLLSLGQASGHGGRVALPYDKRLIAAHLGMTPESLSRSLGQLRPYGVEVRGKEVFLNDIPALAEACKPDRLIDESEPDHRIDPA